MDTFCTQCGAPKLDNGQLLCESCRARAEQAAAAAAVPNGNLRQAENKFEPYLQLAKMMFTAPVSTVRRSLDFTNAVPGAAIGIACSLAMSLIGMLLLRKLWFAIFGVLGGFSSLLYGAAAFPYGSVFFRLLLLFALQWVVLSLVVSGVSRLFNRQISLIQSLNLVGLTKLYTAVSWLAACLLAYVYAPLALGAVLGGMLAGFLAIEKALHSSDASAASNEAQFYLVPAIIAVYVLIGALLVRLFI